jgi:glutamate-1-semialdehyde 2,1-aminomutase
VSSQLWRFGAQLKHRLNTVADEVGLDVRCAGIDVHPHLHFDVPDATLKTQITTLYVQEMAKRGCHGYASFYLNAAQGAAELEQTCAAAREAFTIIRDALATNSVEQTLECPVQQDAFRRLVH